MLSKALLSKALLTRGAKRNMTNKYRMIWEKYYGDIPIGYDIHHIDFDHTNNSIDNLQCLPKEEHMRLHGKVNFNNGVVSSKKVHRDKHSYLSDEVYNRIFN